MTKAELDALELLEKAATPGPLRVEPEHADDAGNFVEATIWYDGDGTHEEPERHVATIRCGLRASEANAQLFSESRNALPRLIADHRRLVELLEEQHATCGRCQRATGYTIPYTPTTPCEAAEYLRQWEGST